MLKRTQKKKHEAHKGNHPHSIGYPGKCFSYFSIRPNKKKIHVCVFQVTWNFKIGMEIGKYFYFVKSFYTGLIGKQYDQMGKSR